MFQSGLIHMEMIKEKRLSLGLSQAVVADMLKISRGYYALVESGKRPLPPEWMELLELLQLSSTRPDAGLEDIVREQRTAVENKVIHQLDRSNRSRKIKLANLENRLLRITNEGEEKELAFQLICKEIKIFESSVSYQKQLAKHKKIIRKKLELRCSIIRQLLEMEIDLLRNQIIQYDLFLENWKTNGIK